MVRHTVFPGDEMRVPRARPAREPSPRSSCPSWSGDCQIWVWQSIITKNLLIQQNAETKMSRQKHLNDRSIAYTAMWT